MADRKNSNKDYKATYSLIALEYAILRAIDRYPDRRFAENFRKTSQIDVEVKKLDKCDLELAKAIISGLTALTLSIYADKHSELVLNTPALAIPAATIGTAFYMGATAALLTAILGTGITENNDEKSIGRISAGAGVIGAISGGILGAQDPQHFLNDVSSEIPGPSGFGIGVFFSTLLASYVANSIVGGVIAATYNKSARKRKAQFLADAVAGSRTSFQDLVAAELSRYKTLPRKIRKVAIDSQSTALQPISLTVTDMNDCNMQIDERPELRIGLGHNGP